MAIKLYNKDGNEVSKRPDINDLEVRKVIIPQAVEMLYIEKYCPFSNDEKKELTLSLISNYYRHCDEYELAKSFEDDSWNVDRDFIDKLEQAVSCIDKALSRSVRAWFDENQPLPPYEIGEKLKLPSWSKTEYGVIDGVYEYEPATYAVKVDGAKDGDTSRRLIKFEDSIIEVEFAEVK